MPTAGLCLLCRQASDGRVCRPCQRALDALAIGPDHCMQCALPLGQSGRVCGRCLSKRPAFDSAHIPYRYEFPLDYLIARYKFHGCRGSGALLGQLFGRWLSQQQLQHPPELILATPLHWRRLLTRGFNQAETLARAASRATGVAHGRRRLLKHRHTSDQHGLPRKERLANIRGAFSAERVRGLHIALVDDVLTTGTTAREISQCLRKAGASSVQIWALARTPEDGH